MSETTDFLEIITLLEYSHVQNATTNMRQKLIYI